MLWWLERPVCNFILLLEGQRSFSAYYQNVKFYQRREHYVLLPATRDAIVVARSIFVTYPWIDVLGYFQDAEEEKTKEIARMNTIHRNAAVTIVASSASGTNAGFLQNRSMSRVWEVPITYHYGSVSSVLLEIPWRAGNNFEPIKKRAWILQEQLLLLRILSYASYTL
ncbi:hypothetical protein PMIN06_008525 [Paraphaeosphaeria minitans]|uniref:HET domain-containing protein n=1 Tax=Paraphaeosphaeria minitans TaxID=565426 RepID=A0A9P6GCJ0_9PLEO|nr:HET domain-containing protein [Paraphaeosphaeria minitans]